MAGVTPLVAKVAPDSIQQLERAAERRFTDAEKLCADRDGWLAAVYLCGYVAEMVLAAAVFRTEGFPANAEIDDETRQRRMRKARTLTDTQGVRLMNSDPHPIVGWARLLAYLLTESGKSVPQSAREAVGIAEKLYEHWRPALRYKTKQVSEKQLEEVTQAARWFLDNKRRLRS